MEKGLITMEDVEMAVADGELLQFYVFEISC